LQDDLILYQGKVYVPKDPDLRHDIVHAHHDSPAAGHPGRWKTLELVSRNYWWPGLPRYIGSYVSGCDTCQRVKSFPASKVGKLMPNKVPSRRWQVISVDVIGELPLSRGYDAILVVVDRLSKRIHAIPTTTQMDSSGMARLFLEHVWRHHGLPDEIISDRGPTFVSKFSHELSELLGIKTTPSTAYHPQTDGQTERVNQEIETYLRVFVNHRQNNWADWIPIAEFSYNNHVHSATRRTPFELDTGQHPRMGTEPTRPSLVEAADDFVSHMMQMQDEAKAALMHAAEEMSKYYDRNRAKAPEYHVGDQVWLNARNYSTDRPTKKLDHKWLGPFKVLKIISRAALKLQLTAKERGIHPVVSASNVRKYHADRISERPTYQMPGPTLVDGEEEYEVEEILDSKVIRGNLHYYVKWKGYPNSENSWIPAQNAHTPDLISDFHHLHPRAPGPHSTTTTPRRRGLRRG
jgi:transposase InsO family protein